MYETACGASLVFDSTPHEEDAMSALEQLPDSWVSDRDEPFFRITARLLPSTTVEAASALLASYDDDPVVPSAVDVTARASAARAAVRSQVRS